MAADNVWHPVSSSNVDAVRRVGNDLEVRFRAKGRNPRKRTWHYDGAGGELERMLGYHSKGKFVRWILRPAYGDGYEV